MYRSYLFGLLFVLLLPNTRGFSVSPVAINVGGVYSAPYVAENEEYPGFIYEIVRDGFARQGISTKINVFPRKRAEHLVNSHQFEAMFPSLKSDPKLFVYSDPVFTVRGASLEQSAARRSQLKAGPALPSPAMTWDADSIFNAIDMVNSGRAKSARVDPFVTAEALIARRSPLIANLKIAGGEDQLSYHVAFSKSNPASKNLLEEFNKGLAALKTQGKISEILERYGYQDLVRSPKIAHIAVPDSHPVRLLKDLSQEFLKSKAGFDLQWHLMDENLLRKRVSVSLLLRDLSFDAFGLEPGELLIHKDGGALHAFSEDSARSLRLDDLSPPVLYGIQWDKKIFAVPYSAYTNVTFYRKDLFSAKGLKMPSAPTFKDLEDLAQALHDPARGIAGICFRGLPGINENMAILRNLFASADDDALSAILEPDLVNPKWIGVVKRYASVLALYGPANASDLGYSQNLALFKAGKCAMWPDVSTAAGEIFDFKGSKVASKTGIVDPPYFEVEDEKRLMSYRTISISSYSQKKRLLEEFLVWTASTGFQDAMVAKYGWIHLPLGIRPSLFKSKDFQNHAVFAAAMKTNFQEYKFRNPTYIDPVMIQAVKEYYGIWPTFSEILGQNITDVLEKKKTVTKAMEDSQRKTKAVYYQSRNQMQK